MDSAARSIDVRSRKSTSSARSTDASVGRTSSAVTRAPSLVKIVAVAAPMPDAAPVTTTWRPAYPSTSSMFPPTKLTAKMMTTGIQI